MAHKRNGLVPIASALADLPGPVKAIRETSPQATCGFTEGDSWSRPDQADPTETSWHG